MQKCTRMRHFVCHWRTSSHVTLMMSAWPKYSPRSLVKHFQYQCFPGYTFLFSVCWCSAIQLIVCVILGVAYMYNDLIFAFITYCCVVVNVFIFFSYALQLIEIQMCLAQCHYITKTVNIAVNHFNVQRGKCNASATEIHNNNTQQDWTCRF